MKRKLLIGSLFIAIVVSIIVLSAQSSTTTTALTEFYRKYFPEWIVYPKIVINGAIITVRQAVHIYEYFFLGVVVMLLILRKDQQIGRTLGAFLFCLLFSNLDQLSKLFIPGREYDPIDLIYDTIGYISGILLVNVGYFLYKKMKIVMKEKNTATINDELHSVLKASIWHTPYIPTQPVDYQRIYDEMRTQAVAGLPTEWVRGNIALSPVLMQEWNQKNMQQIYSFYQLLHLQDELIQLLHNKGMHPVILKGCAAAVYYPQPEFRSMGDIDVLVSPEEFEACFQIMTENGYEIPADENFRGYHVNFRKSGIHFELHRKPAGVEDNARGDYLLQIVLQGLRCTETRRISEYQIPILPPLQNGIVLLLHIEKHLREGLGLRQIIDWMMFADKNLNDDMWEQDFETVFQKGGLKTLAVTVTRMCQIYLGLRTENMTWCEHADTSLCNRLMEYVMEQGNFGVKKRGIEHGANVLSRTGSIWDFIKSFQLNGEQNWRLLEKHPKLRCLAWLYQIWHYIKSALFRKHALRKTINDLKVASQRKRMLKRLGGYQKSVK